VPTTAVQLSSSLAPSWMDDHRVRCKGATAFFYPNQPSSEVAQAKAVCNGTKENAPCVFRDVCLHHAIDYHESYGVWGGTSERDRRKIQRARNKFKNAEIYNLEDVRFPHYIKVQTRRVIVVQRREVATHLKMIKGGISI
jgi:WhiB family transcriptional regulator, redox-sensing transcriptional regulator